MNPKPAKWVCWLLLLAVAQSGELLGQKAKQYVYFGGRLVAVENLNISAINRAPSDLSLGPAQQNMRRTTLELRATDLDGGANIMQMNVVIGPWYNAIRTCYFYYTRPSHTISLNNNTGDGFLDLNLNAAGPAHVENDWCRIHRQNTAVTTSGDNFALQLDIEFKPFLGGPSLGAPNEPLYIWSWARDYGMAAVGWVQAGNYTPGNSGGPNGLSAELTDNPDKRRIIAKFRSSDPDGGRNVFQINSLLSTIGYTVGTGSCLLVYNAVNNYLYLYSAPTQSPPDTWLEMPLDAWSNVQQMETDSCIVRRSGTGLYDTDATTIELRVNLEFKQAMTGTMQVWNWSRDMANVGFGWQLTASSQLP
jgi:hypothetical protein